MRSKFAEEVRAFNRYYTNVIGLLNQNLLDSDFSLPECRILYELGKRRKCTASDLIRELNMDRGYCSRVIRSFEKRKIIVRKQSSTDGRSFFLSLTNGGKKAFTQIDRKSHDEITALLRPLSSAQSKKLVAHMQAIRELLNTSRP